MEMPVDVLTHRLGKIRDNGTIDFDQTAAALDIDSELQEKFLSIPYEEIDRIEIEDERGQLTVGSGPEHCAANTSENPEWLYNHALNALALWRKLLKDQEEQEERERIMARRPQPGIYQANGGTDNFIIIVTEDQRLIVPQTVGEPIDGTDIWDRTTHATWQLRRLDPAAGTYAE